MLDRTLSISAERPVRTGRLILRPYRADDLSNLYGLFGREDVCRYLPWPAMDLDQARAKLEQRLQQTHIGPSQQAIVPAAFEATTGRFVGEFMLRVPTWGEPQGELGWSIHPDFQGRGFATEGAREMLRLGFEDLGLHRIYADADARNEASLKVMDRLGMRREAHLVEASWLKGAWVDDVIGAMLDSEWQSSVG